MTLAAEPVGTIFGIPITNALVNSWLTVILFLIISFIIQRQIKKGRGKLMQGAEMLVERLTALSDQITGSRKQTLRFLSFFSAIFLFVLASNWLGLLPGTGTIGFWRIEDGAKEFIPLLRPATSDLNTTLGLALLALVVSHVLGVKTHGGWKYINRFLRFRDLWSGIRQGGMQVVVGFVNFFVGLMEIVSEGSKVLSLSLRLFGNILAGEILLGVIAGLVGLAVPLPFIGLEIIVGIVQATIFAVLTLVYMTIAVTEHEEHA